MSLHYSHSYEDPETGEYVDVLEADDDDDDDDDDDVAGFRNARMRRHRGTPPRHRTEGRPGRRGRPGYRRRTYYPPPAPPAYGGGNTIVTRPAGPRGPVVVDDDHLSIRKTALVEFIPAIGKLWAAFLGTPDAPTATGDDIIDRNNAAQHRDALSRHTQSQTRILALSDLAAQAVKMFTE